jgi:uncharacterized protein YukE
MNHRYDTDSLRSAGSQFISHGQTMAQIHQRLIAATSGLAAASGGDDPGRKFHSTIQPHVDALLRITGQMPAGLESGGRALRTMADNFERADQHSAVPRR